MHSAVYSPWTCLHASMILLSNVRMYADGGTHSSDRSLKFYNGGPSEFISYAQVFFNWPVLIET